MASICLLLVWDQAFGNGHNDLPIGWHCLIVCTRNANVKNLSFFTWYEYKVKSAADI